MSTHKICFCCEIRKYNVYHFFFVWKKKPRLIWSNDSGIYRLYSKDPYQTVWLRRLSCISIVYIFPKRQFFTRRCTNKFESGYNICYYIACAPSEDSDRSAHPRSLISLHRALWVANNPKWLRADSEDSDQSARMRRLIWVFAGRTCYLVANAVSRLIILCRINFIAGSSMTHWLVQNSE